MNEGISPVSVEEIGSTGTTGSPQLAGEDIPRRSDDIILGEARPVSPQPTKSDSELLKEREENAKAVEGELKDITRELDIDERIIFSTAYRFSRDVPEPGDYDFLDAMGEEVGNSLVNLTGDLREHGQSLTPGVLWNRLPKIDPHHAIREEINAKRVSEVVVFDPSATAVPTREVA